MWPFRKYEVAEKIQELDTTKDGPNNVDIVKWLNCGIVNGHRPSLFIGIRSNLPFGYNFIYIFECQRCGFRIKRTEEQLSSTERGALINLGYACLNKD